MVEFVFYPCYTNIIDEVMAKNNLFNWRTAFMDWAGFLENVFAFLRNSYNVYRKEFLAICGVYFFITILCIYLLKKIIKKNRTIKTIKLQAESDIKAIQMDCEKKKKDCFDSYERDKQSIRDSCESEKQAIRDSCESDKQAIIEA